jgi:hypothetical protein
MKANTAALKYAYANALTISWGDDPEADTKTDKAATDGGKSKGQSRRTSSKSPAAKDASGLPDPEQIRKAILEADDKNSLEYLKPAITKLKNDRPDEYKSLVSEFKKRREELS